MQGTAIFVLSDMRSGSTLLDQLLGAHPSIMSLGELHWLAAYVLQDRKIYDPVHELICTCGQRLMQCPFWTSVATDMRRPLQSLRLRPSFVKFTADAGLCGRLRRLPTRLVDAFPAMYRSRLVQGFFGAAQVGRDSVDLFKSVLSVSGRRFVVDSSKSSFRFRTIYDRQPGTTRAILLARDYRAVVHSKMKRGESMVAAAVGWRKKMMQIEAVTADLPAGHKYRMKFEALCENPARELSALCHFLGLEFSAAMVERPVSDTHHIGGSPSKFDPSRIAISLDTAYRQAFDATELRRISKLVRPMAHKWGY
ncbi:MAG: sulfotransferase [Steroidobacteraceae bacterium]